MKEQQSRMKRLLRHWMSSDAQRNRLFSAASLQRITEAIAQSEKTHSGELRFALEVALESGEVWRNKSARERAIDVFSELRVWDTEQNNGVLIYLLLADHDVEIIADRGIHAKVGAARWEEICQAMEVKFRAGEFETGVLLGVAQISAELQRHFPPLAADRNELPDAPVLL